jgi:hypothetical protein
MGWVVSAPPPPTAPRRFTNGEDPVPILWKVGWAPGPVWTGAEPPPPNGIRSPDSPARSKSLYRLSYRGPCRVRIRYKKLKSNLRHAIQETTTTTKTPPASPEPARIKNTVCLQLILSSHPTHRKQQEQDIPHTSRINRHRSQPPTVPTDRPKGTSYRQQTYKQLHHATENLPKQLP